MSNGWDVTIIEFVGSWAVITLFDTVMHGGFGIASPGRNGLTLAITRIRLDALWFPWVWDTCSSSVVSGEVIDAPKFHCNFAAFSKKRAIRLK